MNLSDGKNSWAETMGRSMARADAEKIAHEELLREAGTVTAKLAALGGLGGIGTAALALAKKNPGAAIGGGLGAIHGLMNNGIGGALGEGALGAGLGAGAQHLYGKAQQSPGLALKLDTLKAQAKERLSPTPIADSLKVAMEKEAFGAAIGAALKGAMPAAMNFIKSNPLKAGLGAASAASNFSTARKNGEGLGSALLSGATGAASAL